MAIIMRPVLSILTNTIPAKKRYFLKALRLVKRLILARRPLIDSYEGHQAVTRSVLEGLKSIGASFNYNPSSTAELGSTTLVLTDLEALSQSIDLKKKGFIQKLFAGPTLVIDPADERELLGSQAIDGYLVPSEWTHDFYVKQVPELQGKCKIWPAGVDMDRWMPMDRKPERKVLIYDKLKHGQPIHEYKNYLTELGWDSSIIRYGSYTPDQFLKRLRESQLAIFFSIGESQGIALSETWAADVPTLVWNRGWILLNEKKNQIPASSAPYLNPNLGYFFSDLSSFKEAFHKWEIQRASFHPRQWVSAHLSDNACAEKLLEIMELEQAK